ncbi:MAG: PAC2 family protein [Propioniciclava sp.]
MLDPTALFSWAPHIDQRSIRADTLVITMQNYADAGHASRQLNDQFLQHLPNKLLGTFDADQLVDYTAHRPAITFDKTHFTDYHAPEIALHQVTDTDGRDFLLLAGPEPALQWERVAATIGHVVAQLEVTRTVLVQTMPSPAPHTRPVVVSRYGSDPALVTEPPVLGTFALRAPFSALLMLRMGEAGQPVHGLLAHVPHYLTETDFPPAASALLTAIQDTTQLRLPFNGLDAASTTVRRAIDAQIADNDEMRTLIGALEEQFDTFTESTGVVPPSEQQLPNAEEIGARFEDFLANLTDPDASGEASGG